PTVRQAAVVRLGVDSFVSAGVNLARTHWALGRADQAAQLAKRVLTHAEAEGDPLTLCFALTWCGCLIPLWRGALPICELATSRLKDHAGKHAFSAYYANGVCFEGVLAAQQGNLTNAEVTLRAGLRTLQLGRWQAFYTVFLTSLAEVLLAMDELEQSLVV